MPPLRERKEDIPELVRHFVLKHSHGTWKKINIIDDEVFEIFKNYDWPGNIRELENMIERMLVIAGNSGILNAQMAPYEIRSADDFNKFSGHFNDQIKSFSSLPQYLTSIEEKIIKEFLIKNNYHQTKTAKQLGVSRTDLQYKLKKYNLYKNEK